MRKLIAAFFALAFTVSVAGMASACPFSTTSDDKKEDAVTS